MLYHNKYLKTLGYVVAQSLKEAYSADIDKTKYTKYRLPTLLET